MGACSQTNVPVIEIVTDPCKGSHIASSCIDHVPAIPALEILPGTNLQSVIGTFVVVIQQQAALINQLTVTVEDLQQQIDNL